MKKKMISLCLVAALAATAIIGGTMAYFTDTKSAENTFTVGNVKIELMESSLHRENAGVPNDETSNNELWSDADMEGVPNEKYTAGTGAAFSDQQIKDNAAQYNCTGIKLNPGQSYHKMPYVVNTGANDAYIRVRVMIPHAINIPLLNSSMFTSSALAEGKAEFTMTKDETGNIVRDGMAYDVYTFTRNAALAPEEMTYWNVWGTIHMDADVTNEEVAQHFGEGKLFADGTFPVLVEADAIQADGFADAAAAWAAFDK